MNDKISALGLHDNNIWNSDQSGFEYEPMRNRTPEFKGKRVVDMMVVTHSCTIQLQLSKAGTLGSYLFICFREPTGKGFGPQVQKQFSEVLSICRNVKVTCSKSGKRTTPCCRSGPDFSEAG